MSDLFLPPCQPLSLHHPQVSLQLSVLALQSHHTLSLSCQGHPPSLLATCQLCLQLLNLAAMTWREPGMSEGVRVSLTSFLRVSISSLSFLSSPALHSCTYVSNTFLSFLQPDTHTHTYHLPPPPHSQHSPHLPHLLLLVLLKLLHLLPHLLLKLCHLILQITQALHTGRHSPQRMRSVPATSPAPSLCSAAPSESLGI